MNKGLILALLAGLLVAIWLGSRQSSHHRAEPTPTSAPQPVTASELPASASAPTPLAPSPGTPAPRDPHRPPTTATAPSQLPPAITQGASPGAPSAEAQMNAVRTILRDYRAAFAENPVGTNAEITRALAGRNPRKVNLFPDSPDSFPRNARGELLDHWGRPFFFHQISGTIMEVRSAGPDGTMWTADDLFMK